jgi:FkbM family methyltransferase
MSDLRRTPKYDDLIYDIGLHHGQDTDFYLKKGFRVVGFEAEPANIAFCRRRFEREIADGRLTIVEGAITDVKANGGGVRFFRNEDHSLWGSTSESWALRNSVMGTTSEVIRVPAVDLGAAMREHGVPHYLKADIVGSETVCLRALMQVKNRPDHISIRSEKLVFNKLEQEFDLLESLGYSRFKAVKQDFERITSDLPSDNGRHVHHFEAGSSGPFGDETPGRWKTRREVIADYRRIFVKYWLFGDYSYLIQTTAGRKFIAAVERFTRRSLPGWYDTHAKLGVIAGCFAFLSDLSTI